MKRFYMKNRDICVKDISIMIGNHKYYLLGITKRGCVLYIRFMNTHFNNKVVGTSSIDKEYRLGINLRGKNKIDNVDNFINDYYDKYEYDIRVVKYDVKNQKIKSNTYDSMLRYASNKCGLKLKKLNVYGLDDIDMKKISYEEHQKNIEYLIKHFKDYYIYLNLSENAIPKFVEYVYCLYVGLDNIPMFWDKKAPKNAGSIHLLLNSTQEKIQKMLGYVKKDNGVK